MDFLGKFPVEEVESIFSHVTFNEALESTLIAPKANEIISNSAKFLQRCGFMVKRFENNKITRKYSQLDFVQLPSTLPAVQNWLGSLTQVTFYECIICIEEHARTFDHRVRLFLQREQQK